MKVSLDPHPLIGLLFVVITLGAERTVEDGTR
jgi:hypothetical protein